MHRHAWYGTAVASRRLVAASTASPDGIWASAPAVQAPGVPRGRRLRGRVSPTGSSPTRLKMLALCRGPAARTPAPLSKLCLRYAGAEDASNLVPACMKASRRRRPAGGGVVSTPSLRHAQCFEAACRIIRADVLEKQPVRVIGADAVPGPRQLSRRPRGTRGTRGAWRAGRGDACSTGDETPAFNLCYE